jgi:hypothetical protein
MHKVWRTFASDESLISSWSPLQLLTCWHVLLMA